MDAGIKEGIERMENISQNSVSARLSRANFEVIKTLVDYFPNRVVKFMS